MKGLSDQQCAEIAAEFNAAGKGTCDVTIAQVRAIESGEDRTESHPAWVKLNAAIQRTLFMNNAPNIAGKPVLTIPRRVIINMKSGFKEKLLCDGPTFTAGDACVYSCAFCYVEAQMARAPGIAEALEQAGKPFDEIVIRRANPLETMRTQLYEGNGTARYKELGGADKRVIYASPLVDVAATVELCQETTELCRMILDATDWQIRLLSKSAFLPRIALALENTHKDAKARMIFGVSTGTLDDGIAKVFEKGTALVSKRISSLHWLQDNGWRTYGMICPSLPQRDYHDFARRASVAIRAEKCEHVWAEVINVRGESFTRTEAALRGAGYEWEADELRRVSTNSQAWEQYSRDTFEGHEGLYADGKLRFLQYVNTNNMPYWAEKKKTGAVLLGALIHP